VVYISNSLDKGIWETEIEDTTPEFLSFMEFIGTKVDLSIWPRYRGDLKAGMSMMHACIPAS
jgi:hypothetical protein